MLSSPSESQASKGKRATEATKSADAATANARQGDVESLQQAASAHRSAQWAHQDAGNGTQAEKHKKQATVWQEKASAAYRDKDYAQSTSRDADALTRKAGLAKHGKDKDDPRAEAELHKAAAAAHDRAAKAHALAGNKREQAYHEEKAAQHTAVAKGDASSTHNPY